MRTLGMLRPGKSQASWPGTSWAFPVGCGAPVTARAERRGMSRPAEGACLPSPRSLSRRVVMVVICCHCAGSPRWATDQVHTVRMAGLWSLDGVAVRLVPMQAAHIGALLEAALEDRSTFTFAPVPWDRRSMTSYVEQALTARRQGTQYPFVTYAADLGRIVGSTRFYGLEPWDWTPIDPELRPGPRAPGTPDVVNIGYTWLAPLAQRTQINTEAKLLMLTHAFEHWSARAVRIQTDARNLRSRKAIERLGCHLDGVLRCERPGADGTVRDTASYSLLAEEWPAAKARLTDRLVRA